MDIHGEPSGAMLVHVLMEIIGFLLQVIQNLHGFPRQVVPAQGDAMFSFFFPVFVKRVRKGFELIDERVQVGFIITPDLGGVNQVFKQVDVPFDVLERLPVIVTEPQVPRVVFGEGKRAAESLGYAPSTS